MKTYRGLAAVAVLGIALAGCEKTPTGPADGSRNPVRGITLVDWTRDGYADPEAGFQVGRLAATGANRVAIVITAYQSDASSSTVRVDPALTPSERSVANIVLQGRTQSIPLEIALKLHVDVDDGAWRGTILPTDPASWFASYGAFVMTWASYAHQNDIEQLVIGTELAGTLEYEDRWRRLLADVRSVYGGEIVYAASWDEAGLVPFWDQVDVAGVNFYAPVAFRDDTHRFEILKHWQPWLERMRRLHKQAGCDVLLTEIGYRSINGAGQHPYDFGRDAPVDMGEQADLYWAAIEAVSEHPWIRGMYWWNWPARRFGARERVDFTPQDKLAERELIDAWR